jgi:hypothetical protein
MALEFTTSYLEDSIFLFRYYKKLAEHAMQQATESQLYELIDPDANSIAIVVQHMAGNMKSRWTNFLAEDGESRGAIATANLTSRMPQQDRPCCRCGKRVGAACSRRLNL